MAARRKAVRNGGPRVSLGKTGILEVSELQHSSKSPGFATACAAGDVPTLHAGGPYFLSDS